MQILQRTFFILSPPPPPGKKKEGEKSRGGSPSKLHLRGVLSDSLTGDL